MRRAIVKVCAYFILLSCDRQVCLVGDFGLATSPLAAVDTANLTPKSITMESDMTLGPYVPNISVLLLKSCRKLEVGTKLYIAPEVQSRKRRGPRDHSKADMYSLGVNLFCSSCDVYLSLHVDRFL